MDSDLQIVKSVASKMRELADILDSLEGLPPQAGMVQPVVGPPDAGPLVEEPGALARRQIIAKVRAYMEREVRHLSVFYVAEDFRDTFDRRCKTMLLELERLIGT